MSWQATDYVLNNSKSVKTERNVLLAIASHADAETFQAWPGLETIARMCGGVSTRTVQRSVQALRASGELQISEHGAPQYDRPKQKRPNLYVIVRESCGDTGVMTETDSVVTKVASVVTKSEFCHDREVSHEPSIKPLLESSSEPRHDEDEYSELIAHLADKRYEKKLREGGIKNPERASRYKAQVRMSIRSNEMDRVRSLIADNLGTSDLAELADFDVNGKPQVDQRNVGARQPTYRGGKSYLPCRLCMGVDPEKGGCQRCGGTGEQLDGFSEELGGYIAYPDVLDGLPVCERYLVNLGSFYETANDGSCYWLDGAPFTDENNQARVIAEALESASPDAQMFELAARRASAETKPSVTSRLSRVGR